MVFKQGVRFFDELTSFQKGGMLFGKRAYAFWEKGVCFLGKGRMLFGKRAYAFWEKGVCFLGKGRMLFGKRAYAFGKLQTAFADCRQSCPSVSVLPVEHYWNMY